MSAYKTTHLPPDEIDKLRFRAFATNKKSDVEAYYKAASLYFQERHERAMNRSDLCDPTQDERVKALVKAVRELREYAVILAEPKQLHAVDAALRALEQGEG